MEENNFIRGDSYVIEFTLSDENNENIELDSIDTLILTARIYPDSSILFSKNKKDFKLENKVYVVEILPQDTQELIIDKFYYDIEITLIDGTRSSYLGIIDLEKDITTHTSGGVSDEN